MCNGKFIFNTETIRIWTDPKGNVREGAQGAKKGGGVKIGRDKER